MNNPKYMSTKHDSYRPKNLQGEIKDTTELFQPDYVKMDRHVNKKYFYSKKKSFFVFL